MKKLLASLLSGALLLSLAACGGGTIPDLSGSASASSPGDMGQKEDPPPRDIPFTLAFYPEFSLHPTLAANRANLTLSPLLYESLFAVDASFQAQPVLCESCTVSEDKLVWTFTLRDRVTFSDGAPLDGAAVAAALDLARRLECVVVLKGPGTVVADPGGRAMLCPAGNCGMAKGGSGDVLAGMVLSLIGQGAAPFDAAVCAVWLHGRAGDLCAGELTEYAMIPPDLIERLPAVFKEL